MKNKIYGRIYMILNLINGKRYIGQTTQSIKRRFQGHIKDSKNPKTAITKAIKKYGKENFIFGEICIAYNQYELNLLESKYINEYKTLNKNFGYNLITVDLNGTYKISNETKEKLKIIRSKPENIQASIKAGKLSRGRIHLNSSSKYCGVCKRKNTWFSYININHKQISVGNFNTEIEAAQARDIAELEHLGDEAVLNFPKLKEKYLNNEIIINKKCKFGKKSNSNVRGVSFSNTRNRWIVQIKNFKVKTFKNKLDAETYASECYKSK